MFTTPSKPCAAAAMKLVGLALSLCLFALAAPMTAAGQPTQTHPLAQAAVSHHKGPRSCRRHHHRRCITIRAQLASVQQESRRAPHITVTGGTLHWRAVGHIQTYEFVRKVPGEPDRYSVIKGTTITPGPAIGKTVRYSVRTYIEGSKWAEEVAIAYVAQTTSSASPQPQQNSSPQPQQNSSPQPQPETSSTPAPVQPSAPTSQAPQSQPTAPASNEPAQTSTSSDSSSSSAMPFVKGVAEDPMGWGASAAPQIAEEVHGLGAEWVRVDLRWSEVMPSPGVFKWSAFDKVMQVAQAQNLHVLPILGYAPSWTAPSDAAGYAEFVTAAVERYGPGTTANLQWFELWNEPYYSYAWSGKTPEPGAYARDVEAASQSAKAIAPAAKFLLAGEYADGEQTGGSNQWETHWIPDMFAAVPDLGHWIDGIAVHPYGGDPALPVAEPGSFRDTHGQWAFQRIDTMHAQFLAQGVNVPFWITEIGWSTRDMSEATQAQYYNDLGPAVAARPWIRAMFSYTLRECQEHPSDNQSQYGLLKFGSWSPKPAYGALKTDFAALS